MDDGSENRGELTEFAEVTGVVRMMVAQKDIDFSNSMIEAFNKNLHNYIRDRQFSSIEALQEFLDWVREDYNHRPQDALHGLTPHEVFHGMIPDKNMFREKIATARKERIVINRAFDCDSCSNIILTEQVSIS